MRATKTDVGSVIEAPECQQKLSTYLEYFRGVLKLIL